MSERYQMVYKMPSNLFFDGCPVLIEAGAIQKDTMTGKILAQLKLYNISSKTIVACKVRLKAYSVSDDQLDGVNSFSYLDLQVNGGEFFGTKTPIYLPDLETRRISVAVTQVVFSDNDSWSNDEDVEWSAVPDSKAINQYIQDEELLKQYRIIVGNNSAFYPQKINGLFLCTCGNINLESVERCNKCHREYSKLIQILDVEELSNSTKLRLAKEKEIQEEKLKAAKKAEEERIARWIKIKKNLKIAIPVLIASIIAIILLNHFVIIPMGKRSDVERLIKARKYQEALRILRDLGEDSSSELVQSCNYQLGLEAMESGEYATAIEYFETAGDYEDASQLINKSRVYVELIDIRETLEDSVVEAYSLLCELDSDLPEAVELMDLCNIYIPYCGDYSWCIDGTTYNFSSDFAISERGDVYWLYDGDCPYLSGYGSFYYYSMSVGSNMEIANTLRPATHFVVNVYFANGRISTRYSGYMTYDTAPWGEISNLRDHYDSGEIYASPA